MRSSKASSTCPEASHRPASTHRNKTTVQPPVLETTEKMSVLPLRKTSSSKRPFGLFIGHHVSIHCRQPSNKYNYKAPNFELALSALRNVSRSCFFRATLSPASMFRLGLSTQNDRLQRCEESRTHELSSGDPFAVLSFGSY